MPILPTYQLDDVLMVELLHDVGLLQELLRHAGVRFHLAGLHSDVGSGGWRVGGGGGPVHAAVHVAKLSLTDDLAQFYPRSVKTKKLQTKETDHAPGHGLINYKGTNTKCVLQNFQTGDTVNGIFDPAL